VVGVTSPDIDVEEIGDVINVFVCPECGEDLRLEVRDRLHSEYVAAICPEECFAVALRAAGTLDLDSEAATRRAAGWCVQCLEQVVDPDDAVDVTHGGESNIVHNGGCAEEFHRDQRRAGGDAP
jgi:hypothetical protein